MKTAYIRSRKLLRAADGASCIRCGVQDATIVAAHYQGWRSSAYGKGRGIKPHDLCTAELCWRCHVALDQSKSSERIALSEEFLHCIVMTLIRHVNEGRITLP